MVLRLFFSSFVILVFLLGFVFHLKNEQTVLVDFIFAEVAFKVSWIVLVSMFLGSLLTALSFLPAYLKNSAKIWQLEKRGKNQ